MNRYGRWIALAGVALVAAIIAIPNLLSTTYVKQQISIQISQLVGRQVSIDGSSSISLRPYLGVSYKDVTISDEFDAKGKPLVAMEGIKARLGLISALFGNAEISELELVRPQFNLRVDQNGHNNWSMDNGLLGAQFNSPGMIGDLQLGTLKIIDGIVELNDEQSRVTRQLTAINGEIFWPSSQSAGKVDLTSVWNGEVATISLSARNPVGFLRGDESPISARIIANPLTLSFDGSVEDHFGKANGTLTLNSPSPKRLADWLGLKISFLENLGPSALSGPVIMENSQLDVSEAELNVEDHEGRGRLQIGLLEPDLLSISGTLAFDSLELPDLSALILVQDASEQVKNNYDPALFDGLALDIRLSAASAMTNPLEMSNLAASVIIRDGQASFDIGQAETMGGVVAGSLALESGEEGLALGADISLNDIALDQLSNLNEDALVSLEGTGVLKVKLKSTGQNARELILKLNGEGSLSGKDGSLIGVDFQEVAAAVGENANSVILLSSNSTEFTELNLGFFFANGTAFLRDSELDNETLKLSLGGRSDLLKQNLALRGTIISKSEVEDEGSARSFFVGGTIGSPFIVPLSAPPVERN